MLHMLHMRNPTYNASAYVRDPLVECSIIDYRLCLLSFLVAKLHTMIEFIALKITYSCFKVVHKICNRNYYMLVSNR